MHYSPIHTKGDPSSQCAKEPDAFFTQMKSKTCKTAERGSESFSWKKERKKELFLGSFEIDSFQDMADYKCFLVRSGAQCKLIWLTMSINCSFSSLKSLSSFSSLLLSLSSARGQVERFPCSTKGLLVDTLLSLSVLPTLALPLRNHHFINFSFLSCVGMLVSMYRRK